MDEVDNDDDDGHTFFRNLSLLGFRAISLFPLQIGGRASCVVCPVSCTSARHKYREKVDCAQTFRCSHGNVKAA